MATGPISTDATFTVFTIVYIDHKMGQVISSIVKILNLSGDLI